VLDAAVDETLAWLDSLDLAALPAVVEKARLLLLDTIACATAGFAERELEALVAQLGGEPGRVAWPGMQQSLSAADAAYAATVAACWHEACEGLAEAHGRPGLHAIPAALSLGCAASLPVGRILDAIIWGYELGARFGCVMRIQPGLHVDGTWGALGAAAAAARAMGGDRALVLQSMASAACQIPASLYLPIAEGHTARNLYAAHAAAAAVLRARAVASGISAPRGAFEAAAPFLAGRAQALPAWPTPGRFLCLDAYMKPFAAVRHVHYPAAAAIALRRDRTFDPAAIEAIAVEIYPEALIYCGNRAPRTAIQAQFSLSYGTVFALRSGGLGPDAYGRAMLEDPAQRRLEAMVILAADPTIEGRAARVTVRAGGQNFSASAGPVKGDPSLPMRAEDVIEKAMQFMTPVIGEAAAAGVVRAVRETPLDRPFGPPVLQGAVESRLSA
jgi:2-methylcitrate dehydratase PrpD